MHVDATTIIVAIITAVAGTIGVIVSRRGQARSEQLEEKRNEIERQRSDADRMAKTYDAMESMLTAAIAQHAHCEETRAAESERHERQMAAANTHADALTAALATLQSIVTTEIAEAAAEQFDDDDSVEGREQIKEFMRTMRQIGGSR